MTGLLVFFLVICSIFGLIGIGLVIGANRKPAEPPYLNPTEPPPMYGCGYQPIGARMPLPPSPQKRYTGRLTGIELPPVRREPPPMPAIKPARVVTRRIHIRRNWIINKWQVIVLRGGITIYRSFDTLAETFACAKWWHEHWDDKPCAV